MPPELGGILDVRSRGRQARRRARRARRPRAPTSRRPRPPFAPIAATAYRPRRSSRRSYKTDLFILIPNALGGLLGMVQLAVYTIISRRERNRDDAVANKGAYGTLPMDKL